jgi:rubrerythrin
MMKDKEDRDMDSKVIRDEFFDQYVEFYNGGPVPEYASNDFSYYLECHRKRLDQKGIRAVKKIEKIEDNIDNTFNKEKQPYILDMTYKECNFETDYYKDDVMLAKSDNDTETLYCNILHKQDYQEETISCPNCGHCAGARSFVNGCPMCGTTFKTFKFFPCVTSFYTLPKFVERSSIDKGLKGVVKFGIIAGIAVAIGVGLYNGIANQSWGAGIFFGIIAGLLTGWLGTIFLYLGYSLFVGVTAFSKMFAQAADTSDIQAARFTKRKFENDMRMYFPDFSYEYFEGKIVSLLRSIIFSDDRSNLSIYKGKNQLGYLNDVVDVEYRGGFKYEGCTVVGDILHVRLINYVSCEVWCDGKLSKHQRNFKMELIRRLKTNDDLGFSIHAVNCSTCGATFDAMHVDKCPHCGNPYELINDDWVVIFVQ